MTAREAEIVIETWQFRERALPRVPPSGWATTDRLREAVCLAVACSVDGVERIEPFSGPASDRERFDATVTTESIDDEHVHLLSTPTEADTEGSTAAGREPDFEERTTQFDLDEALERL